MELKGKVALVTGGAVRVGRALTLALAEAGCHVFIHYGRSAGPTQQTQVDARKFGAEAPLKRPGSPEIVAQNVLHLLRQDFLTGVIIPIDGGQFL